MLISHWCKLFEKMEASPRELYAAVEKALAGRQIPALEVGRVDWHEGGLLSARREYLHLTRERLVFDICAAPFGTGFFVSSRLVEEPLHIGVLSIVGVLLVIAFVVTLFIQILGLFWGVFFVTAFLVATVWFLRSVISRGLTDVDAALMKLPLFGPVYERFFRATTYYRIDATQMFQQAVHAAVMEAIDQTLSPKAVRPLSEEERRPVLAELFRR